jgi:RNA recognition motif-containing protein
LNEITGFEWYLAVSLVMSWRLFVSAFSMERMSSMDVTLYIGNLAKSTVEEELRELFSQVGEVTSLNIMKDRATGESNEYGFLTMSTQSEADKVVSRFNNYSLNEHRLKVSLTKPRPKSG